MKVTKYPGKIEIDLHGLMRDDAEYRLRHLLTNAGKDVKEVVVIHGYSRGTALRDMIRRTYAGHPKVIRLELGMNPGVTELVLREY